MNTEKEEEQCWQDQYLDEQLQHLHRPDSGYVCMTCFTIRMIGYFFATVTLIILGLVAYFYFR